MSRLQFIVVPCTVSKTYDYLHTDRVLAFLYIVTQMISALDTLFFV